MRYLPILTALFFVAACDMMQQSASEVDPAKLAPMTGQERALITAAEVAVHNGNYASAEKNYLTAIGQSKGHVEAHLALAELYQKQNKTELAKEVLEKAIIFQPKHVAINYMLGKIYMAEDRPSAALTAFNRGLKNQPSSLDLLSGAGVANDMLREHDAAQVLYLRALSLNPAADLSAVRTNLAMSYLLDNKPEKAAELLKAEARKKDASPVTRHNLALAYGMLGRHTEAKDLVHGEMSEADRLDSLKRLSAYIAGRDKITGRATPAPMSPVMVKEAK